MVEDIIRLCQGSEIIAVARLDGTIIDCTECGVERSFGLKPVDILSKNILTLVDSAQDQMEFQKLVQSGDRIINGSSAETTCLIRAKGTRIFIWADRRPPDGEYYSGSPDCGLLPHKAVRSPVLNDASSFSCRTKVNSEKTYYALDTNDMSFNDVFEESISASMCSSNITSNVVTPSASEHSLEVGSGNALSPRESAHSEEESHWGWFMTVSPSSSVTFSNITSQIRVL